MDVVARHPVVGRSHLLKGPVRNGKQRVAAEHGLDHVAVFVFRPLGELRVLLNGLIALVHAVPLGYLVAQAGPHAQLPAHVLDGEQGARNLPITGMMVKDRSHAVPDAVQDSGVG